MAPGNENPQPREHRALHGLIAICLLVLAQLNLLLHPDPALVPAANLPAPIAHQTSPGRLLAQKTISQDSAHSDRKDISAPTLVSNDEEPVSSSVKPYSAFALVRDGNQFLSKRSQDKVVQIIWQESRRSASH